MEQFIKEIRAYARSTGKSPTAIIQKAGNCNGQSWDKWLAGGGCSVKIMDRIRKYIADNPAEGK